MECSHGWLCFPLSEWICLLPGSNVCEPLHLEAFLPRTIIEIPVSLEETTENDPDVRVCPM